MTFKSHLYNTELFPNHLLHYRVNKRDKQSKTDMKSIGLQRSLSQVLCHCQDTKRQSTQNKDLKSVVRGLLINMTCIKQLRLVSICYSTPELGD